MGRIDGSAGVVVAVRGGVRLVLDWGIAGIDVSCRDGLVLTNTTQTTSPMTTATEKPAIAHSQGRGPRGGSGGRSTGGMDPVCGYVCVQYCGSGCVGAGFDGMDVGA
jgi:hypothetical protein